MDKKKNYYQLIPKKELKCVWMTAGLLSYKLCKYDLQCEKCPLDWELRNLSATPSFAFNSLSGRENISSEEAGPTSSLEKGKARGGFLGEDLSL